MSSDRGPISALWRSGRWRAGATSWIDARLADRGLVRTGEIDQLRVRPWSTNLRVPCGDAPRRQVWFKACTDGSAYEPNLVSQLSRHEPDLVASPWATDEARGWMLTPDEGPTFRDVVGPEARLERWAMVLHRYAELQVRASRWPDLARTGAPWHTPADLVESWRAMATGSGALLQRAERALQHAAERMEASGLPPTIQHDDLHTGNVFASDDGNESICAVTIFDWGDAYIGHPFCSLLIGLRCLDHQYDLHLSDGQRTNLVDAYLEPWSAFAPRASLRGLVPDAMLIARIGRVLGWRKSMARASAREHEDWDEHASRWLAEVTSIAVGVN